jgi:putative IMPACT (imprinted ancient) family translation regulator
MLTALLHGGVGEIVAVCIRYYGGTKLGTGGLTRAYAGGVKLLLESLPTEERVQRSRMKVIVDYGSLDALQRLLGEVEALVETQDFGERVELSLAVPEESVHRFEQEVAGITKGRGVVTLVED